MNRFIVYLQDRVPVSFSCDLELLILLWAGKSDKFNAFSVWEILHLLNCKNSVALR